MLGCVPRPRAVVVTGSGVHTDRWHDLDATSAAVASILAEQFDVHITSTEQVAELPRAELPPAELIVLNATGDLERAPTDSRPVVDAILAAHEGGAALLALHASSLAFRDDPRWPRLLGGRWVPETSGHPPIGPATVTYAGGAPFGAGGFELFDERYTALERHPGTLLVATHTEAGDTHPLVWARGPARGARVVYDALGHDIRSYESTGRRRLIADATAWLLR